MTNNEIAFEKQVQELVRKSVEQWFTQHGSQLDSTSSQVMSMSMTPYNWVKLEQIVSESIATVQAFYKLNRRVT